MQLQFEGDCNNEAVKQKIKDSFKASVGQEVEEIHCGRQTVVDRRKRSGHMTLSIKMIAGVSTKFSASSEDCKESKPLCTEKAAREVIEKLKVESKIKAKKLDQKVKGFHNWRSMDGRISKFVTSKVHDRTNETCADKVDVLDDTKTDYMKKCCKSYHYLLTCP